MGPDETLSPALLKKVAHAACSARFQQATEDLRVLAEVKVSANRIHRAVQRVGIERIADRRAAATAYQQLPLASWRQSPVPAPPDVACVQADGGRIQIRPRVAQAKASDSWWRETKVGCLLAMTSEPHAEDPDPRIPEAFVDPARMAKICREIKGISGEVAVSESASEERAPPLRLVIVPRHPDRFAEVGKLLSASGLAWQRRSELDSNGPDPAARILLVDRVGELGAWWGTSHIAYVGGSMGNRNGQNMIEPAAYGAAVSFGPRTKNFRDVVAALLNEQAAIVVNDGAELTAFVRRCLEEPQFAEELGVRARRVVASQLGATERTVDLVDAVLRTHCDSERRSRSAA